ncbi:hypothetical protein JZ785_10595 [Alicyclobacillus curvatus]|nr:hypothetical protein JZ785_10595 [Alicyclobacillus curvatus]
MSPIPEGLGAEQVPIINKITFGGQLIVTTVEERKGYKGRLFSAKAGQLIDGKIRLKQGSCCVVVYRQIEMEVLVIEKSLV